MTYDISSPIVCKYVRALEWIMNTTFNTSTNPNPPDEISLGMFIALTLLTAFVLVFGSWWIVPLWYIKFSCKR